MKKKEKHKQKAEEDNKAVKEQNGKYNVINQTDSIKKSIKEQANNEKASLSEEYDNKIEILKQDYKEYDDTIKNKCINDIIAIDETYKMNKENMVLREAVNIKKVAEDIIIKKRKQKKKL